MKILYAASEAQPLVKTGGLGDVSASLPPALRRLRHDVRLVLPAYPAARAQVRGLQPVAELTLPKVPGTVRLLQGRFPGTQLPLYLVDSPLHFDRAGDPYRATNGRDWQDNHLRFGTFARAIVELALDRAGLSWQPNVVHCNDWQTGLVPALLSEHDKRPHTVFTIHNLSYQGLFPPSVRNELELPASLWSPEGLEFYDHLSFIKGGLAFADRITTVSPTYAREIQTPALGYGLDGLLRYRSADLLGILNGIDCKAWNPAKDTHLTTSYDADHLTGKTIAKQALQERMGLPVDADSLLFGHIGRLVEQKGVDLILQAIPPLLEDRPVQLVVLGSGEPHLETGLQELREAFPDQVGLHLGYDETLAHQIEAGSDAFLMPSRFEPCGLNQMYSLRYGTPPVVHSTGGLTDTVVDTNDETIARGEGTGFVFNAPDPLALREAMGRTIDLFADKVRWQELQQRGMGVDLCWEQRAREYLDLYKSLQRQAP